MMLSWRDATYINLCSYLYLCNMLFLLLTLRVHRPMLPLGAKMKDDLDGYFLVVLMRLRLPAEP